MLNTFWHELCIVFNKIFCTRKLQTGGTINAATISMGRRSTRENYRRGKTIDAGKLSPQENNGRGKTIDAGGINAGTIDAGNY